MTTRKPGKHRKISRIRALLRRYSILPAAGTAAALVVIAATAGSDPANAAAAMHAPAGEQRFCIAFERFGETPDFTGLDRSREAVPYANPATQRAYWRFQWLLLGGYPRWQLRRSGYAVYDACQVAGVRFAVKR